MENKIKIGVTHGDINGTSYEIMLKTFQETRFEEICTPIIYGSPKVAGYYRKALNINNFNFNQVQNASEAQTHKANMVNILGDEVKVELGKGSQLSSEAAIVSLDAGINDIVNGNIDALILNPINTKIAEEINSTNQFDYVKQKLGAGKTVTMLVNDTIRVALLADATPMRDISKHITTDNVVSKLHIISDALKSDFGIEKPKIAVLGYNPNCTTTANPEREEKEVLLPAIETANNEGVLAMGPYEADQIFGTSLFKEFDAVLAIYYEQGLVPFRALCYDDGVSYLLGVPQLCVAPFQPIGYEIAGLDRAMPNAFQKAIYLACDIADKRQQYKELTSNVLKKHSISD